MRATLVLVLLVSFIVAIYAQGLNTPTCIVGTPSGTFHQFGKVEQKIRKEGNVILAQTTDNELKVEAVVSKFQFPAKAIHGLSRVAVDFAGNKLVHAGAFYTLNGAVGAALSSVQNAKVSQKDDTFTIATKNYIVTIQSKATNTIPQFFFTVAITPVNKEINLNGLCQGNADFKPNAEPISVIDQTPAQKETSQKLCSSFAPGSHDFRVCLSDHKVSKGDATALENIKNVAELRNLIQMGHFKSKGSLVSAYALLRRFYAKLNAEKGKAALTGEQTSVSIVDHKKRLADLNKVIMADQAKLAADTRKANEEKAKLESSLSSLETQNKITIGNLNDMQTELDVIVSLMEMIASMQGQKDMNLQPVTSDHIQKVVAQRKLNKSIAPKPPKKSTNIFRKPTGKSLKPKQKPTITSSFKGGVKVKKTSKAGKRTNRKRKTNSRSKANRAGKSRKTSKSRSRKTTRRAGRKTTRRATRKAGRKTARTSRTKTAPKSSKTRRTGAKSSQKSNKRKRSNRVKRVKLGSRKCKCVCPAKFSGARLQPVATPTEVKTDSTQKKSSKVSTGSRTCKCVCPARKIETIVPVPTTQPPQATITTEVAPKVGASGIAPRTTSTVIAPATATGVKSGASSTVSSPKTSQIVSSTNIVRPATSATKTKKTAKRTKKTATKTKKATTTKNTVAKKTTKKSTKSNTKKSKKDSKKSSKKTVSKSSRGTKKTKVTKKATQKSSVNHKTVARQTNASSSASSSGQSSKRRRRGSKRVRRIARRVARRARAAAKKAGKSKKEIRAAGRKAFKRVVKRARVARSNKKNNRKQAGKRFVMRVRAAAPKRAAVARAAPRPSGGGRRKSFVRRVFGRRR